MTLPKWLEEKETTRKRSRKQETKIAKDLNGRATINSGATFGENDVVVDFAEIEAKTTKHNSFSLKMEDWTKLRKKSNVKKIPAMVIDFESSNRSLAVIDYEDLKYLISLANR